MKFGRFEVTPKGLIAIVVIVVLVAIMVICAPTTTTTFGVWDFLTKLLGK